MTQTQSTRGPDIALLFVAAMWGASYLAAKSLTEVAPAVVVLALRFIPSAFLLIGLALLTRSRMSKSVLWIGGVLGGIQAVTLLLETGAVARTSATNAGVIVSLAIVIAPIAEGLVSGKRLPAIYFVATGAAFGGVVILISANGFTSPNLGDLLILLAAFTRSALVVTSSHLTANRAVNVIALSTVSGVLNGLIFTALSAGQLSGIARDLDVGQWLVVAFLSVGCTLLAFLIQLWAISRTSATRASLLMGTEPVWAVLAGVTLGGEGLTILTVAGAVVVIAATFWGQRIEMAWRESRKAPADVTSPAALASES